MYNQGLYSCASSGGRKGLCPFAFPARGDCRPPGPLAVCPLSLAGQEGGGGVGGVMSIYSFNLSKVARGAGQSSVAALSYIFSEPMYDQRYGERYSGYSRRERVVSRHFRLPEGASRDWVDAQTFFNALEMYEKADNACVAKKVMVALPRELDRDTRELVLEDFAEKYFLANGCGVAWAVHCDSGDSNPHAHFLVANRQIVKGGFGAKQKSRYKLDANGDRVALIDPKTGEQKVDKRNRKQWKRERVIYNPLDTQEFIHVLRAGWAEVCNRELDRVGAVRIDHRSLKDQGIDRKPMIHEGYAAREIEKRGEVSEQCEMNRLIKRDNEELAREKEELDKISRRVQAGQAKGAAAAPLETVVAGVEHRRLEDRGKGQFEGLPVIVVREYERLRPLRETWAEKFMDAARRIINSQRPLRELLKIAREQIARLLGVHEQDGNPFAVKLGRVGIIPDRQEEVFEPKGSWISRSFEKRKWETDQQQRAEALKGRFAQAGGWRLLDQVNHKRLINEEKTRIQTELEKLVDTSKRVHPSPVLSQPVKSEVVTTGVKAQFGSGMWKEQQIQNMVANGVSKAAAQELIDAQIGFKYAPGEKLKRAQVLDKIRQKTQQAKRPHQQQPAPPARHHNSHDLSM